MQKDKKLKLKNYNRKYKQKFKDRIRKQKKEWNKNNPEKVKLMKKKDYEKNSEAYKKRAKKRYVEKKEEILEKNYKRDKLRYQNNKEFNVEIRLRASLNFALKTYSKEGKIMSSKKYGINYKEIIEHLKPFPNNLSKYHVDHIRSLCTFNLEDPIEVKKAFSPENLRWLTAKENQSRSKRCMGDIETIIIPESINPIIGIEK